MSAANYSNLAPHQLAAKACWLCRCAKAPTIGQLLTIGVAAWVGADNYDESACFQAACVALKAQAVQP